MSDALALRAALIRGALVTMANWPVILIEFALESLFNMALVVPVVGGALMVRVLAGGELRPMFAEGVRAAAGLVVSALVGAPVALGSFLLAAGIVGAGGSLVMFFVKSGTLSVLVAGERAIGDVRRGPLGYDMLAQAHAFGIPALLAGIQKFGGRSIHLSLWLSGAYAGLAAGYLTMLAAAYKLAGRPELGSAWPLVVAAATGTAIVSVTIINLVFDLMRIIVICDDCSVRQAASRLRSFLLHDTRQVVGILAVVTLLFVLTAAASLLVAAGLALVAWVPFVGLIVVPLQAAAWIIRGLLFQYMGLSALSAYETQYRRFSEG